MNILETMTDRKLFAGFFKRRLLSGDSWRAWKAFLSALFALPMDADALATFQKHTGRTQRPAEPFQEAFVIVGRRGGKSLIAALIAVFLACFRDYSDVLVPGETGTLMVLAVDREQAQVIFQYINAFLSIPILRGMVVGRFKESIELNNRVTIAIHTSNYRAIRGRTLIGVIADELAFWSAEDSANPDREVLNAVRPGLATTGGLLLAISSPYGKHGELWRAYKENFGKDDSPALVWKATSREMNLSLSMATVALAFARDPVAAKSEWGAEFRDIESFLGETPVENCLVRGRFELAFRSGTHYVAFVDPSGGRSDSMAMAIGHLENDKAILDLVREVKPPFSPEGAVEEFTADLRRYHVSEVTGDYYSAEWCREQFLKRRINYKVSEKTRSELYLELFPVILSRQCELLDHSGLLKQLSSLERRTGRGGKDVIDHTLGAHDDLANVCAGCLTLVVQSAGDVLGYIKFLSSGEAQKLLDKQAAPPVTATSKPKPDQPPACPVCDAKTTIRLGARGNIHCNSCSADFDEAGNVTSVPQASDICPNGPYRGAPHSFQVGGGVRRCMHCGFQPPGNDPTNGFSRRDYPPRRPF